MGNTAQNGGSEDPVGDDRDQASQQPSLEERRRQLGAKLAAHDPKEKAAKADGMGKSPYAKAFQLSTEFIAAIFVGALLGYLLDRFLGTTPWGMIVFLLLGFVAGVLNVMRSAGLVAENQPIGSQDRHDNDAQG